MREGSKREKKGQKFIQIADIRRMNFLVHKVQVSTIIFEKVMDDVVWGYFTGWSADFLEIRGCIFCGEFKFVKNNFEEGKILKWKSFLLTAKS